jgi:hypothetical protein
MSREIESNFTNEYGNEEKHCHNCDSFRFENGRRICNELKIEITENSHCDFFRSID